MPKINSLEVVHQDTNKDQFETLHDILVGLRNSLAVDREIVDGDARVAIENLLEMYVNDKEAFLRSLQTLTAQFKNSSAIFSEEILLKASEIEALARRISTLSASVENTNSALYEETNLRATADEAFAQNISTLSATVESKNRTYYQTTAPSTELVVGDLWIDLDDGDKLHRWNGSSWDDVQDAQIGVNTAAITNEALARSTGDSANATAINAVTARLDTGDFATVKTQSYANASAITGLQAQWGVQVDVNGNVAGIKLNSSSTGTSEFTVVANNFKVYGSGGQESIQNPIDVTVAGSTQRVGLGNAMIVYYEGTNINRWAAINNIKTSGIYSRPTAPAIVDLPYSWANEAAGFFAGNAGTGGNYHGVRGAVFTNNGTSLTSRGIVGSHTGAAFYAEVGGYAPFTGEHNSVIYKDYEIQEGQIVVDKEIVMKKDISNTLSRVEKSNIPNQKGVIGVFTKNNGAMSKISTMSVISEHTVDDGFGNLTGPLTEQYDQIKDLYDVVSINALGEGQILVCGENGNISTGDLIVTSSVEGVGMKQADDIIRSYTVAKAREDITFDDTTTPKLVSCIYLCG